MKISNQQLLWAHSLRLILYKLFLLYDPSYDSRDHERILTKILTLSCLDPSKLVLVSIIDGNTVLKHDIAPDTRISTWRSLKTTEASAATIGNGAVAHVLPLDNNLGLVSFTTDEDSEILEVFSGAAGKSVTAYLSLKESHD